MTETEEKTTIETFRTQETGKDEDREVPAVDEHPYQDCYPREFPFIVDAPQLLFIGRIGEEPVYAHFTIENPRPDPYFYKIKTSCNEMFRVKRAIGRIEKESAATISVQYYPLPRQPSYTQYIEVHALCVGVDDQWAYKAWQAEDRLPELPKRIFVDFIWHPHVGLSQAMIYGELYERLKKKKGIRNVGDMTYKLRKGIRQLAEKPEQQQIIAENEETAPDRAKRLAREHEQDNDPTKITAMIANARRADVNGWVAKFFSDEKKQCESVKQRARDYLKELERKGAQKLNRQKYPDVEKDEEKEKEKKKKSRETKTRTKTMTKKKKKKKGGRGTLKDGQQKNLK